MQKVATVKTYLVEYNDGDVIEYCSKLMDAKRTVEKYAPNGGRIIMMRGSYFGEGYHFYKLTLNKGKYSKETLR